LPIFIFEPRSFLQMITSAWSYAPSLLSKANAAKDPVMRFKWTMAFALAGLHKTVVQRKPFNPILGNLQRPVCHVLCVWTPCVCNACGTAELCFFKCKCSITNTRGDGHCHFGVSTGETYQATFSDGATIFCEQTSHHPPISHFQVLASDGAYKLQGWAGYEASFRGNSVKGYPHAHMNVFFAGYVPSAVFTHVYVYMLRACVLCRGRRQQTGPHTAVFADGHTIQWSVHNDCHDISTIQPNTVSSCLFLLTSASAFACRAH
jgi:hypothetical protein